MTPEEIPTVADKPAALPVPSPAPRRRGGRMAIVLLVILALPALGFAAWAWLTLHVSYSNGERVGYVQKISQKGWTCKTWEGELAMVSMPGTLPQIFAFSVRDDSVARRIMDAGGQRVALVYEQHRFVPTQCFGETEYYIVDVREVKQ
jgi:hypothetical protein